MTQAPASIITKVDALPAMEAMSTPPVEKTPEGLNLEVHISAETLSGGVKRGTVKPNIPTFSAFELLCDEGTMIGGTDSAPAPLSYLAAGVAFCFLTHLKSYADAQKLTIDNIKVEQKMKFQSRIPGVTAEMGNQMEGHSNGLETHVLITSNEAPAALQKMIDVAHKACMAAQTVVTPVPATTTLYINGQESC